MRTDLDDILTFLGSATPPEWIEAALAHQEILLLDHKACEYKAASNAINLMAKYQTHAELVDAMSRLAREELVHHEQVMKLIKKRGIALRPLSAARYASGLRTMVRRSEPGMMTDILVISAFIEARSCERFAALYPHLDEELGKFYKGLLDSEGRHFRNYLKLANLYGDADDIAARIDAIRPVEQALIHDPDPEFRFHSGLPVLVAA
ncbi:tRNA-(ms[2]io[6]A)-hydroxylase [Asticcacaulis excentricus]|uniref:tRNA-hydroxylase n=1 Tax=Asticcacaulis excentricus (strain ATCC 15261 / DSM 4724 / KCTC 12464 / NCIMB 9791 / VKM B-1370 / CB 48) TaxID=573065 RepID=E8RSB5_ASTEC|nr:tRNA-(ms[2]io[6]A)-hydroxylase [Asticcacaulis excentricus]ADU14386.1 tRNA-hydroxylase [Asticcacaulis excentricus CB 48]